MARIAGAVADVFLVAWLVVAIVLVLVQYAVLPQVAGHREDLERLASRASGETVRIGAIDAVWTGLAPTLSLTDVTVDDASGNRVLSVAAAAAVPSWRSVTSWTLRLARLTIAGAAVTIERDADGTIVVAGHPLQKKATRDDRAAEWLLAQDDIRIRGASVVWRDAMVAEGAATPPPALTVADVALSVERSGRSHRVALRAVPPAALAAPIDVRAVIEHPLFASRLADPATWSGELYADVASGDVAAWRAWVPLPPTFDGGRGRVRGWLRFAAADAPAGSFARRLAARIHRPIPEQLDRVADVTADLALDDIAVRWGAIEYAKVASVDGRVAASQTKTAQHLAATRMALQPHGDRKVPPTDFRVDRTIGESLDDETGRASLGAIDIAVSLGLVPLPLVPPAIADRLVALAPHGVLENVAVTWTGPIAAPTTFDVDARFSGVGIAAQAPTAAAIAKAAATSTAANGLVRKPHAPFGEPGFDRIDGTLHATRKKVGDAPAVTDATIALAGHDVTVVAPGLFDEPTLRLANVAADVAVKVAGADVEIRVTRASLDNADLAVAADVVFRHGPNSGGTGDDGGRGWIDLDARIARADVARVARYLPNIVGQRARLYLSKALVAGRVTGASLRMLGALDRLDLRAQPDALARPYAVPVHDVLPAVRDGRPRPVAAQPRATPAFGTADASAEPVFHAEVHVHDATYLYGPARSPDEPPLTNTAVPGIPSIAWPAFDHVEADVVFDQAKMVLHAKSASVYGYRLEDITAELPALADPAHVLRVTGRGAGPLQDLVRFVNESPIARWIRHYTDNTRATGDATFALALDLPLTHPRDAAVAASIGFRDDQLALNAVIPPLRHVAGRVDFSDRGLDIDELTGEALGGPLKIAAKTEADGFIDLQAAGTIDVAALRAETGRGDSGIATPVVVGVDRLARVLSGRADYRARLRLRSSRVAALAEDLPVPVPGAPASGAASPPSQSDIVVESDLAGLAIDLPAPLDKPADARWPLKVTLSRTASVSRPADDAEDIRITLADRVDAAISRRRDADAQFAVSRAGYAVGGAAAPAAGPSELRVDVPEIDADAWRDAIRRIAGERAAPAAASAAPNTSFDRLLPTRATVHAPLVKAASRDFTNVTATVERTSSGWQADLAGDQVVGRLSYSDVSGRVETRSGVAPAASGRLVARLSKLAIPAANAGATPAARPVDPNRDRDFPAIDVVADSLELRGRQLGRLEVVADNVQAGDGREWRLQKLGLTTPEARFDATGTWRHGADEHTRLDFDLVSSNVGALLDRFGVVRTIADGDAHLTGRASWSGGPTTIDFATLDGHLTLAADKGRFLKAEPGVAKLLNILSLQGLARRLTLDFSDVFGAGFAFDSVRADATIEHGIATTDDFTMRGVQALVRMAGQADLEHETTNLHVVVLPQINAGAASLGVAVINPVVGLATFVAQYLFKDRISNALSFEYNVRGPWTRPEVTKIDHAGHETPVKPKAPPATAAEARNP